MSTPSKVSPLGAFVRRHRVLLAGWLGALAVPYLWAVGVLALLDEPPLRLNVPLDGRGRIEQPLHVVSADTYMIALSIRAPNNRGDLLAGVAGGKLQLPVRWLLTKRDQPTAPLAQGESDAVIKRECSKLICKLPLQSAPLLPGDYVLKAELLQDVPALAGLEGDIGVSSTRDLRWVKQGTMMITTIFPLLFIATSLALLWHVGALVMKWLRARREAQTRA